MVNYYVCVSSCICRSSLCDFCEFLTWAVVDVQYCVESVAAWVVKRGEMTMWAALFVAAFADNVVVAAAGIAGVVLVEVYVVILTADATKFFSLPTHDYDDLAQVLSSAWTLQRKWSRR